MKWLMALVIPALGACSSQPALTESQVMRRICMANTVPNAAIDCLIRVNIFETSSFSDVNPNHLPKKKRPDLNPADFVLEE